MSLLDCVDILLDIPYQQDRQAMKKKLLGALKLLDSSLFVPHNFIIVT
jgi:hypothetical protein